MITSWEEIDQRFDKIKNHKPRAAKKLQELGEILSSAYLISPRKADEMWQYIIELNIADSIDFSKFYIAQVYKKIATILPSESAANFALMRPERVRLMFVYGYDGSYSMVDISYSLIGFLLANERFDDALTLTSYIVEKYEGDDDKLASIYAYLVERLWRNDYESDSIPNQSERFDIDERSKGEYLAICMSAYPDSVVGAISSAEACIHNLPIKGLDFSSCLQFLCRSGLGWFFAKYLYAIREYMDDSQAEEWIEEYCSIGSLSDIPLFASDQEVDESTSQVLWLQRVIIESDSLRELAFTQLKGYEIAFPLLRKWIKSGEWNLFIRYIVLALNNADEDRFSRYFGEVSSMLHRYQEYKRNKEKGFNFDFDGSQLLKESNIIDFSIALGKVCAMTDGIPRHRELVELLRAFTSDEFGSVEILRNNGIDTQVDSRSTITRFRDYCAEKLLEASPFDASSSDPQIWKYTHTLSQENTTYGYLTAYMMVPYTEITDYVFLHNAHEASLKADMILGCLVNEQMEKALSLLNLLVETTQYPNFTEKNGWSLDFKSAVVMLLTKIKNENESDYKPVRLKPSVIENALLIANASLEYFSENDKHDIMSAYLQLQPQGDGNDDYISSILSDTDDYIAAIRLPKTKVRYWEIAKVVVNSFEALAKVNRLDVVAAVMRKVIAEDRADIIAWTNGLSRLKPQQVAQLSEIMPDVFAKIIDVSPRERDLLYLARRIGESGNRQAFCRIKHQIVQKKGLISGLNDCFYRSEKNYTPIQIAVGSTISAEFLYFDETKRRNFYYSDSDKDDARKWLFEAFFRVKSQETTISSVGVDELEIDGKSIPDDKIDLTYDGDAAEGILKLCVYSDVYCGKEDSCVAKLIFRIVINRNTRNALIGERIDLGYDFANEQFVMLDGKEDS